MAGRFTVTTKASGLDEAVHELRRREGAAEANAKITTILFAGAKVFEREIADRAPRRSGKLKRAVEATKGRVAAWVAVNLRKLGKEDEKGGARYPYVLEYGAPAHKIVPKRKALKGLFLGRIPSFRAYVQHPGFEPYRYFGGGITAKRREVTRQVRDGIFALVGRK